ncbi:SGNH/GDSL hydrolase family protein [Shouchella shacheensis]|uniref:SGNH/GDSL hydrolase family protein n=1 Tax=Shouchella shacheensis TaxID=1649580 RepID=UPI00073FAD8E|nr:SGNH/GDSL hydrolase family protein [Shouchella shacheensis]
MRTRKRNVVIGVSALALLVGGFFLLQFQLNSSQDEEDPEPVSILPGESYVDYLQRLIQVKPRVEVAVIGSSVTAGMGASDQSHSWAGRTITNLQLMDPNFYKLQLTNYGVNGATIQDLINNGKMEAMVASDPDFIIMETSLLNSHRKDEPLERTNAALDTAVSMIQGAHPATIIVLTSPNPATTKTPEDLNGLGLNYQAYIQSTNTFIAQQGWSYVDTYSAMRLQFEDEGIQLEATLDDGLHPNDVGYKVWADVLWAYLTGEAPVEKEQKEE